MAENSTSIGGRCSMCGHSPLEPKLIDKTFEYGEDDESITVTAHQVPVRACANCGEYYSGREAARVEHEAICQALGLMTPSEIKALRERFGWSQKELAALTGLGIATISRCERGRLVPNRSTNVILMGLRDCAPFREYLEGLLNGSLGTSYEEAEPAVFDIQRPRPNSDACAHPASQEPDQFLSKAMVQQIIDDHIRPLREQVQRLENEVHAATGRK